MRLDPRELRGLKRRDPRLAAAIRSTPAYPGFPSGSPRLSRYESLAKAVVYQQLAGKAAATTSAARGFAQLSGLLPISTS